MNAFRNGSFPGVLFFAEILRAPAVLCVSKTAMSFLKLKHFFFNYSQVFHFGHEPEY